MATFRLRRSDGGSFLRGDDFLRAAIDAMLERGGTISVEFDEGDIVLVLDGPEIEAYAFAATIGATVVEGPSIDVTLGSATIDVEVT